MEIKHFKSDLASPKDEIINLFEKIDEYATKETYDTSTSDMSRDMFFEERENVTDKEALERFYDEYTGEIIVAYKNNKIVGFTIFRENDKYFEQLLPEKTPHIAVNFSGVHPSHQRQGIWTRLRDYLENEIVPNRNVDYILTATSKENHRAKSGNLSREFSVERVITELPEDQTILLSKRV
jgi:ribosomal protein S18 acetylase RimI-like enzyme